MRTASPPPRMLIHTRFPGEPGRGGGACRGAAWSTRAVRDTPCQAEKGSSDNLAGPGMRQPPQSILRPPSGPSPRAQGPGPVWAPTEGSFVVQPHPLVPIPSLSHPNGESSPASWGLGHSDAQQPSLAPQCLSDLHRQALKGLLDLATANFSHLISIPSPMHWLQNTPSTSGPLPRLIPA